MSRCRLRALGDIRCGAPDAGAARCVSRSRRGKYAQEHKPACHDPSIVLRQTVENSLHPEKPFSSKLHSLEKRAFDLPLWEQMWRGAKGAVTGVAIKDAGTQIFFSSGSRSSKSSLGFSGRIREEKG